MGYDEATHMRPVQFRNDVMVRKFRMVLVLASTYKSWSSSCEMETAQWNYGHVWQIISVGMLSNNPKNLIHFGLC